MRHFLGLLSGTWIFVAGVWVGVLWAVYGLSVVDFSESKWYLLLPTGIYLFWAVGALAFGIFLRLVAGRYPESYSVEEPQYRRKLS